MSDIVAEGFSPGVLDSWGLGYDALREIRPDIIYVQQSGMGAQGTYGRFRTVGPIAASFAGSSEMSGLPEPAMPAGWGYSLPRLDGRLQLRARHPQRALPPRAHRRGPVDRRLAVARSGLFLSGTADPRLVGERPHLDAAPATARPTSRQRRTAPIRARATTAGSRSPASPRRSGAR